MSTRLPIMCFFSWVLLIFSNACEDNIKQAPVILSVDPNQVYRTQSTHATITGKNFFAEVYNHHPGLRRTTSLSIGESGTG